MWVSLHGSSLIWIFITYVLIVLTLIYLLHMLRNMFFFIYFWFFMSHHVLNEELNYFIRNMLGFLWLLFVACFKPVFMGMYVCACFMYAYACLKACVHILHICARILMHKGSYYFLFVLISFNHMFRFC